MDWVEDDGTAPYTPPVQGNGLDERLEQWVSRGREFVDGVSGTRPGSRANLRGAGRSSTRRRDGLGRWVEGKLDWLLDDRDDWREPWDTDRTVTPPTSAPPSPPQRPRLPLQAISRRGTVVAPPVRTPAPQPPATGRPTPERARETPERSEMIDTAKEWPEEEVFTVPRWRRQEPAPPAVDPLASAPPPPAPGRPLPRSTRRR
jgi:hypothetical protein